MDKGQLRVVGSDEVTRNIKPDHLDGARHEQFDILGSAATADIKDGVALHIAKHRQLGWPIKPRSRLSRSSSNTAE